MSAAIARRKGTGRESAGRRRQTSQQAVATAVEQGEQLEHGLQGERLAMETPRVASLGQESAHSSRQVWLVDSRATCHCTPHRHWFSEYHAIPPKPVSLADRGVLIAVGIGVIRMEVQHEGTWVPVVLSQAYYIPNLGGNFFSVMSATSKGLRAVFGQLQILGLEGPRDQIQREGSGEAVCAGQQASTRHATAR